MFFGEDESAAAATLATLLGYKRARVLQGGLREFTSTILQAHEPARELTPEEHDTYRFRLKAAPRIATMIAERACWI